MPLGDSARVADEVENAVIDQHVHHAHHKPDQHRHILLFHQQQRQKHAEKRDVQPYIQRRELPPRDNIGHVEPPETHICVVMRL